MQKELILTLVYLIPLISKVDLYNYKRYIAQKKLDCDWKSIFDFLEQIEQNQRFRMLLEGKKTKERKKKKKAVENSDNTENKEIQGGLFC